MELFMPLLFIVLAFIAFPFMALPFILGAFILELPIPLFIAEPLIGPFIGGFIGPFIGGFMGPLIGPFMVGPLRPGVSMLSRSVTPAPSGPRPA
jgi:hypothetical protein